MEETAELTRRWMARIRREDAVALARLRNQAGVEAALHGEQIWLRGTGASREMIRTLADQPIVELFETGDDVLLYPPGRQTPTKRMPEGLVWTGLRELAAPLEFNAGLPGVVKERVPLRLVRDGVSQQVNTLRLSLAGLAVWAERAPEHRFYGLSYACSEDEEVVVLGECLPSVSAERYVRREGVAIPAGWRLEPFVTASVARSMVGAQTNTLVIFDRACRAEVIEMNHFVPLTRASVRLTLNPSAADVR